MTDSNDSSSQGVPCEKYMTKVAFLSLACVTHPHKAIEFAEKIGNDPDQQEELKKSCKLFVEHVNHFRRADEVPTMKNLHFAAGMMWQLFSNQYFRAMGMYLKMMIALMEEGSPECPESTS